MSQSIYFQVTGKVQGVFFRKFTQAEAQSLRLSGWVRNCEDGSVEGVASGSERELKNFIQWLHKGSPMSRVDDVVSKEIQVETFEGFSIR